jgi:chromosome segregation ATPase
MTRTKEVDPDSGDMPDYKSPANRLVHSLRKGYDNVRSKLKDTREQIKYYQIKTRDLEKSRANYKKETLNLKETISHLEKENEKLKKLVEDVEIKKNRKTCNHS